MTIRKKATQKAGSASKAARATEAPQARRHPEHSAAYEATMGSYAAALDLVHKREYATALEGFLAVEKAAVEEPELAERARTYAAVCNRKLAPPPVWPTSAEDRYHLGVVRANEGSVEEAIRLYDVALQQEPGSARILYARASARALQANTSAAVADLRQAVAADAKCRHQAANDPDFERIRDEAAFIDVIEPTPTGA